jgi:hypothetical protein
VIDEHHPTFRASHMLVEKLVRHAGEQIHNRGSNSDEIKCSHVNSFGGNRGSALVDAKIEGESCATLRPVGADEH